MFSVNINTSSWWSLFWYGNLIIFFQIGWAVVQISHLSIIPSISRDYTHSADLSTIRYTASVCCGIVVYLITWIVLQTNHDNDQIGPYDFYKFKEISLILSCIGILSSALFYCGLHTVNYNYENTSESNLLNKKQNLLKTSIIYKVSLLYMASRLFTILNLIYIPLFLEERQSVSNSSGDDLRNAIAIVPLVSFASSFLTSIVLKFRTNQITDKCLYIIGSVLSLTACVWIAIQMNVDLHFQIYGIATLTGMGSSSTMISSLCVTAEVAKNHRFGGSVYSTVTFTDKLISGGMVLITQHLSPKTTDLSPNFYGHVLAYVCGGTAIAGLMTISMFSYQH
ncbi:hypothetical protein FQA39_LY17298 [Lamprigera yunnana]|nr:hypothetical protein FQA39_LY17298 [Lamprigera yunnana]